MTIKCLVNNLVSLFTLAAESSGPDLKFNGLNYNITLSIHICAIDMSLALWLGVGWGLMLILISTLYLLILFVLPVSDT